MSNPNIKHTYDYTLASIKGISDNIDVINTRLTIVLTLGGILLNFGNGLLDQAKLLKGINLDFLYNAFLIFHIVSCILIISSMIITLWELVSSKGGCIILPNKLTSEELKNTEEDRYLLSVIKFHEDNNILPLKELRDKKVLGFYWSVRIITFAMIFIGIEEIIITCVQATI
jgi:hypothetical protein